MRIPDRVLAQIADRLDMGEVVSEYVRLEPKGGRLWGLCPFHPEKTPSFSVNSEKGMFYCFGCHKGGSLFGFVMEMEKLSFPEAVRLLAEKAGVELELDQTENREKEAYLELYRRVAGTFHYLLLKHPQASGARAYLHGRGVSQELVERFQIGYALPNPRWLWEFLTGKNYSGEFLSRSGLFAAPRGSGASRSGGPGRGAPPSAGSSHGEQTPDPAGRPRPAALSALFRDRVVFPIRTARDEVVGFGGRTLRAGVEPKYLNTPETSFFHKGELLFGAPEVFRRIRRAGGFVVVEGYMDVIAVESAGSAGAGSAEPEAPPAVAPLGTSITALQLRLLKRFADRGQLLFDADDAGRRAAERAIVLAEQLGVSMEVIEPPGAKDPAEILEKHGEEALKNSLKCSINSFQFLLSSARARHDAGTPDGKESIIRDLFAFLNSIDSQVKRDGYLRLLGEELGVSFESVRSDVLKGERQGRGPGRPLPEREGEKGLSSELFFLLAVAANRDYFPHVRTVVSVEDFEDSRARNLYIALEECFREGETSGEALLRRLEGNELRQILLERIATEEFSISPDRLIQDGLRSVRVRSLERRRRALTQQLAQTPGGESVRMRELLSEKIFLDEELESLKVRVDDRSAE
jgi:DNA primase